ncbi:unnamed protein product [Blepharisma stoltei]|uniref:Uncharacterized protein n=1 Tax=Blepharisma stoltei TaxID=1481888 RepID=A0AAU9K455_9CILI|nr:unnamed protein product [Blepharisma stoltei]
MDKKGHELDFKVRYPQLENFPGELKAGLKRYHVHKNDSSRELFFNVNKLTSKYLILPTVPNRPRRNRSQLDYVSQNISIDAKPKQEELSTLKQQLKTKDQEIAHLRYMVRSNQGFKSVEPEQKHQSNKLSNYDPSSSFLPYSKSNDIKRSTSSHQDLFRDQRLTPLRNRFIPTERNSNPLLEFANHPVFKQPFYSKKNPKIVLNDPITGLNKPSGLSLSPDKPNNHSLTPDIRKSADYYSNYIGESFSRPNLNAERLNKSFV